MSSLVLAVVGFFPFGKRERDLVSSTSMYPEQDVGENIFEKLIIRNFFSSFKKNVLCVIQQLNSSLFLT